MPGFETQSHQEFLKQTHFGSLDGLRAISILLVIAHHARGPTSWPIAENGRLGVQLFFAISGFLITTLMLREQRRSNGINLRNFYIRRTLRIFPLYYSVLLVYCALVFVAETGTLRGQEFWSNLPAFATYTSNLFVREKLGEFPIFFFAWSLAAEEQFYLTWPWVQKLLQEKARVGILAGLLVVKLLIQPFISPLSWMNDFILLRLVDRIPITILLGVLAAHALNRPRGYSALKLALGGRWAAPVILGSMIALLSNIEISGRVSAALVSLPLAALVVACVVREDNGLSRLLKTPVLVRVGAISYGLYMLHMIALNLSKGMLTRVGLHHPSLKLLLGLGLACFMAEISHRTLERYFLSLKTRFGA